MVHQEGQGSVSDVDLGTRVTLLSLSLATWVVSFVVLSGTEWEQEEDAVRRYQPRRERWTSAIGSSPVRLALPPSLVRTPTVSLLALQHNLPWSPDRRVSFPTSLRLATNSSSLASPVA